MIKALILTTLKLCGDITATIGGTIGKRLSLRWFFRALRKALK